MSSERSENNNKINKQNIPRIRYSGFVEEWEEKKLKDVSVINPKTEVPDMFNYIDLESVNSGMLGDIKMINKMEAPSRAQRKLEKKDILFATVRPYQQNNYYFNLDGTYVASTGYAQIRAKENPLYLYYFLHTQHFLNDVMKRCTGTSYPAINSNDLKTINIKVPSKSEQEKIASLFSSIDRKIESMEKKYIKLSNFKRNLLNNTFNKTFNKYERLDKLTFYQEGPGVRNYQYTKKGIKLLNVSNFEKNNLNLSNTDRFISEEDAYGKYNHFLVDEGDLLIACSGIKAEYFDEKIAFAEYKHLPLCMNTSTMRFKSLDNDKLDLGYLKYFFQSQKFKKEVFRVITGSAQFNFGPTHLKYFNIPLPSINKQKYLKDIFLSLDKKISYLEKEINLNKEFKRSLLSKMFC